MSILIRILNSVLGALRMLRIILGTLQEQSVLIRQQADRLQLLEDDLIDQGKTLDQILNLLLLPAADHFVFSVTVEGQPTVEGATTMKLTDSQNAVLTIAPVDKKGAPATLDGVPVWASSDETIATVAADPGGLTATLTAVRPGTCGVTVTGDADLGEGTTPIVGSLDVEVTPGQAVQISIAASDPTEQ